MVEINPKHNKKKCCDAMACNCSDTPTEKAVEPVGEEPKLKIIKVRQNRPKDPKRMIDQVFDLSKNNEFEAWEREINRLIKKGWSFVTEDYYSHETVTSLQQRIEELESGKTFFDMARNCEEWKKENKSLTEERDTLKEAMNEIKLIALNGKNATTNNSMDRYHACSSIVDKIQTLDSIKNKGESDEM